MLHVENIDVLDFMMLVNLVVILVNSKATVNKDTVNIITHYNIMGDKLLLKFGAKFQP